MTLNKIIFFGVPQSRVIFLETKVRLGMSLDQRHGVFFYLPMARSSENTSSVGWDVAKNGVYIFLATRLIYNTKWLIAVFFGPSESLPQSQTRT